MNRSSWIFGCALVAACDVDWNTGGSSLHRDRDREGDHDPRDACVLLDGDYEFTYDRVSGNCDDDRDLQDVFEANGLLDSEVLTFRNGRSVPVQTCLVEQVRVLECVVDLQRTCRLPWPLSGTYAVNGQLETQDEDGVLEGTFELEVSQLGATCRDEYEVEAEWVD